MNGGSVGGWMYKENGPAEMMPARLYARDLIMQMSTHVFNNYPGSRIAIMGMNAYYENRNDERYCFLQYDTPFIESSGLTSTLENTFKADPAQRNDDVAQFLRAAIDKMDGDTSVLYGAKSYTGIVQNSGSHVIPRDKPKSGRIPVIVLMSDFQVYEETVSHNNGSNNSGRPYWSECMATQANRFKNTFADGILLTIRFDHIKSGTLNPDGTFRWNPAQNTVNAGIFNDPIYDNYMNTYVTPASRPNWQFTKLNYDVTPSAALGKVKTVFKEKAPPPPFVSITDDIPEGLTILNTNPTASVTGQNVVWNLSSANPGQIKLTVTTQVTAAPKNAGGDYVNTATLKESGKADVKTNTTSHRLSTDLILHIRQIVIDPVSGIQKPLAGYFRLVNDRHPLQLAADSGVHGYGLTDYTTCKLTLSGNDKIYSVYDFVPQYYEYEGYFQNSGGTAGKEHDNLASMEPSSRTSNGSIQLDYGTKSEYWITVYIRPAGTPDDYEWSYASNDFGVVK